MSNIARLLRQTMTIIRRDFVATVFTPTFLLFLFAPLFMLGFGLVGGMGAQSVTTSGADARRIVVIAPAKQVESIAGADKQLRKLFPRRSELAPPPLLIEAPRGDLAKQARALVDSNDFEAAAVLYGPLDKPEILHIPSGWSEAQFLAQVAEQALRSQKIGSTTPLSAPTLTAVTHEQASVTGKGQAASLGVFGIFFLTLFLSSQVIGTLAEERSNKVIEILAAAVPLESVFLGKLLAMFAIAVLFIVFWATLLANAAQLVPSDYMRTFSGIGSAVGPVAYPLLFIGYFTMAYMLLGAVFLGVGAQTSTPRELQMLSLPITVFQMLMFALALKGTFDGDSWVARTAEIFPFSSPFAMIGRAGNSPDLWPHFVALGWQALWVAVVVALGARWFRRGVLKSGSPRFRMGRRYGRSDSVDSAMR